ncbi:hypothetical protein [Alkaliphilus peptidifermentans]|uniref:Uncharacterized protein n=1 Tax=Alkaliphilus peptidifermentans DSM 18978 TaxID=1120976 RepID=A0A1G5EGI0_9FIRM|nr:hypothetical protein [Alkaliphilus peptidifermentans]SCY26067.1 hypothetical protein SAMN03080606_01152 [Alkaliphilus peptidifermentans DSM 18978]
MDRANRITHVSTNDCFASRKKGCSALKFKACKDCSFYKTTDQHHKDQAKALKRIFSLDKDVQDHINETYYRGKMGGNSYEG